MKIEIEMYFKDIWGRLGKIISCGGNLSLFDNSNPKELWEYKEGEYINSGNIKKTSLNIIDLIEVGDYVNGCRVEKYLESQHDDVIKNGIFVGNKYQALGTFKIKEVLTKEHYENKVFRLGE